MSEVLKGQGTCQLHATSLAQFREMFPCWEKVEVLDRRGYSFEFQLKVFCFVLYKSGANSETGFNSDLFFHRSLSLKVALVKYSKSTTLTF